MTVGGRGANLVELKPELEDESLNSADTAQTRSAHELRAGQSKTNPAGYKPRCSGD